jgi:hypothetical protein
MESTHPAAYHPPVLISSADLEERLALWRAIAEMNRDKHESALIHGQGVLAAAIDFGADGLEQCISDIEELITAAGGGEDREAVS